MLVVKKIKPMFTGIVTTADKYSETEFVPGTNIIDASKTRQNLKEYQKVIAVGDMVRGIEVGDYVCINPKNYEVKKFKQNSIKNDIESMTNETVGYNFNMINLDGVDCLMLQDRDIEFVIQEFEEVEDEKPTIKTVESSPTPLTDKGGDLNGSTLIMN